MLFLTCDFKMFPIDKPITTNGGCSGAEAGGSAFHVADPGSRKAGFPQQEAKRLPGSQEETGTELSRPYNLDIWSIDKAPPSPKIPNIVSLPSSWLDMFHLSHRCLIFYVA